MKLKSLLLIAIVALISAPSFANKNKVIGIWLTQDKDSKIEITQDESGKFIGKVIWLENPTENGKPQLDDENPEEKLQSRPILGLTLLEGFKYDADDEEWDSGTIYDPKTGNTYKCYMWFDKDENTLNVKGYIGVSIIGRKVSWTRVK
ncbi:DUF2147 domain-containing protein [Labilibacter marinus]|uniref:DUF2147 domain-containing protein n=1 Tax=Labilibacter marinus TaxID=1477105 RepID=UPI00094FC211|nr:DUF2147 domain-containing protein [Labilibacter marinus]